MSLHDNSTGQPDSGVAIDQASSITNAKIISEGMDNKRPAHDVVLAAWIQGHLLGKNLNLGQAVGRSINVAKISSMANSKIGSSVRDVVGIEMGASECAVQIS